MVMTTTDKKPAVLVIEDEEVLRHLLVLSLRGEGYTVLEAANGKAGSEQALKYHPRLVLLDIVMPTMNGIDMLKFLRRDAWGKTADIMLLTNLDDIDDLEKAKTYGVTDYLVKSDWSLEELVRQVQQRIGQ